MDNDEGPQHRVTVKPFLLCRTEVTQAAWEKLMGSNPSHWWGPDLPVEQVTWDQAKEWCQKVGLRLPTEAEWEYACRAGTTSPFCFGVDDNRLGEYAWFGSNSGNQTYPVGQKNPNAFGLSDMHGNVCEWCEDDWHDNYGGAPGDGGAWSGGSSNRVFRGGGWIFFPQGCRSANRFRSGTGDRNEDYLGFRPACSIP